MKKVVYLGYVISPEKVNSILGASVAGNKMQWNVIKNLARMEDIQIACVTVTPLAAYPRDKKVYQRYVKEELFPGVISHRVAYCNLPVIKQIWQTISVYRMAKKVVKEIGAETLFCFNLFPQVGVPMRWLKKKYPRLDTICLLADLPIDDNTSRKGIFVWLRRLMEKSTWKSMKACERYIVLNKHVIEKYLPGKSYIVIDGGVDEADIERYATPVEKGSERNILYCGALTEYNGILNLIRAINSLEDIDITLDIYGGGYLEEVVKKAAENDPKIRYYGRVDNQTVMQKQQEAWLLINPRIVDDPIAQVTFPSKIFEYLLSGTPVLSTKLNGYGEEYNGKLIYTESDSPEAMATAIRMAFDLSEEVLKQIADDAKKLVTGSKNWAVQCTKIYKYIEN